MPTGTTAYFGRGRWFWWACIYTIVAGWWAYPKHSLHQLLQWCLAKNPLCPVDKHKTITNTIPIWFPEADPDRRYFIVNSFPVNVQPIFGENACYLPGVLWYSLYPYQSQRSYIVLQHPNNRYLTTTAVVHVPQAQGTRMYQNRGSVARRLVFTCCMGGHI